MYLEYLLVTDSFYLSIEALSLSSYKYPNATQVVPINFSMNLHHDKCIKLSTQTCVCRLSVM